MLFFKFIFLLFLCRMSKIVYTEENPIQSNILLPYRFNHIIFAVSIYCTEETFKKLLHGFIQLEKLAHENSNALTWQTIVNFGGGYSVTLNSTYTLDDILQCTQCFNYSRVKDIDATYLNAIAAMKYSECDGLCVGVQLATKQYTLVISDVCIGGTPETNSGLMLETENDVKDCTREISHTWDLFSANITSNIIKEYGNMYEYFSTYPLLSKINFMAIIKNNNFGILYDILKCKIFNPNGLCRGNWHSFIGLFKIVSDDEKQQKIIKMSLPLYFNEEDSFKWFMDNYKNLTIKDYYEERYKYDCGVINNFLKKINTNFVNSFDDERYNVLIIEDSLSKCLDFDLRWYNNTKRRLEIIVLHSEIINKEPYANLIYQKPRIPYISYNNEINSHMYFYNTNDNNSISDFCEYSTICESKVPYWLINEFPQLDEVLTSSTENVEISSSESMQTTKMLNYTSFETMETTTFFERTSVKIQDSNDSETIISSTISLQNSANNTAIKIGGAAICVICSGLFIVLFIRKILQKKKQKAFKNEIHSRVKNVAFNSQISEEKHCKLFVESKNVAINFEEIKGKGAYATVFTGSIIENTTFNLIHKTITSKSLSLTKIAIKIQSKFENHEAEEFLAELNSLKTLKSHTNIIKVLGWSILQETPILITELADTNLLKYVQTFSNHQNPLKLSLQFLWQISDALYFVAEKKMIHRDVACRNILLFNTNIAKLADFGLCCNCEKNGTFKDSMQKKFPVKWLSIEVLKHGIFSEKSDIWAFGVLCFEVFSYGEVPYPTIKYQDMLKFYDEGKRLEKPKDAPSYLYELMEECWNEDPEKRPTFKEINKKIRLMLEKETVKYGYVILS